MTTTTDYNYRFKIVVIGDTGAGKSCLLLRLAEDCFRESASSTIGVDFKNKLIEIDAKKILLHMWDTSGQERFRAITPSYFRGAHGVALVYDCTSQESFESLKKWLFDVDQYANDDVSRIIIGNRCDLETLKTVDYLTAKAFADRLGISFLETSAKDGTNVEQAFVTLAEDIKNRIDQLSRYPDRKETVQMEFKPTKTGSCGC